MNLKISFWKGILPYFQLTFTKHEVVNWQFFVTQSRETKSQSTTQDGANF